jgi:hypothetical protein
MRENPLTGEHEDCIRTEPHWPAQCVAPYPQGLHDPEYCDLDNVHLVPSRCHAPEELPHA